MKLDNAFLTLTIDRGSGKNGVPFLYTLRLQSQGKSIGAVQKESMSEACGIVRDALRLCDDDFCSETKEKFEKLLAVFQDTIKAGPLFDR